MLPNYTLLRCTSCHLANTLSQNPKDRRLPVRQAGLGICEKGLLSPGTRCTTSNVPRRAPIAYSCPIVLTCDLYNIMVLPNTLNSQLHPLDPDAERDSSITGCLCLAWSMACVQEHVSVSDAVSEIETCYVSGPTPCMSLIVTRRLRYVARTNQDFWTADGRSLRYTRTSVSDNFPRPPCESPMLDSSYRVSDGGKGINWRVGS